MDVQLRKDVPRSQRPRSTIGLLTSGGGGGGGGGGGREGRVERSDVLKDTAIRASVRDDRSWIRNMGGYDNTDSASNGRNLLGRRSLTLPAHRSSEERSLPERCESTDSSDDEAGSRAPTRIYSVEGTQKKIAGGQQLQQQQLQQQQLQQPPNAVTTSGQSAETEADVADGQESRISPSVTRARFHSRPPSKSSSLPRSLIPPGGARGGSDSPDANVVIQKRSTSVLSSSSAAAMPPAHGSNAWRKCSRCGSSLGKRTAFILEYLGLYYHEECFKCASCSCSLGHVGDGHKLRIVAKKVNCDACYKKKMGL
ncbi:LIM domain only protein 7-like isoform X3 [Lethenteron reissneri]|uniref:LIM domain only protein 7-like isoform X3 n=1 Tax=Lethenteron reissneri TaxID=7753 RepID=UPI002AB689E8|nr:LIM domain only protein 7-like isoform X3 [Lethenteron reissneri]